MNAALVLSGDTTAVRGARARRPVSAAHRAPRASHVQRRPAASNTIARRSAENANCVNGRWNGSYVVSDARESAAASATWSKARARVRRPGSTMTNSLPSGIALRYQNRSPASQVGRTAPR